MGSDKTNAAAKIADGVVDSVLDSSAKDAAETSGRLQKGSLKDRREGSDETLEPKETSNGVRGDRDQRESDSVADPDAEPTVMLEAPSATADDEPTAALGAASPAAAGPGSVTTPTQPMPEAPDTTPERWRQSPVWRAQEPVPSANYANPPASFDHHGQSDDEHSESDDDWYEEYHDGALFTTIFAAPSLALAAFVFALTGLLGGMIPESLPYLVQLDPGAGPAFHVRIVGMIALGFAIIAASLGLAAMLRSIGSPLRWPRYLGGAAVLLALLIALQSVLLIVLAGLAPEQGGMN
ncbi:MAG: hypothetical protein ACRDTQ_07235 [Micromonosporaceae bacterium]